MDSFAIDEITNSSYMTNLQFKQIYAEPEVEVTMLCASQIICQSCASQIICQSETFESTVDDWTPIEI